MSQTTQIKNGNFTVDKRKRRFLKLMGAAGAGFALSMFTPFSPFSLKNAVKNALSQESSKKFAIKRTVCLQCHSACGVQVTVADYGTDFETAIKIEGNPYHPNTGLKNIEYETDPNTLVRSSDGYPIKSGKICAKGRAGIQYLYYPYRIKHPLKRVGPRGSGKWKVISWDEALDEICGIKQGQLPSPDGTSTYTFDGLKQIRDSNPNQFVFMIGRAEHGRKELTDRLWKDAFGTKNHRNDHTSICELSHHIAWKLSFGGKSHIGTDIMSAEFIIWFGTSPLEANFPMISLANRLMEAKHSRDNPLKMVVVDPRYSRSAAKADKWVPVRPGADGALAAGMIAWMLENGWYDKNFLKNANVATAENSTPKEFSCTDATHLVIVDPTHANYLKKATDNDLGLGTTGNNVILKNGTPTVFSDSDTDAIGDLDENNLLDLDNNYETTPINVNGVLCKTVFQLLKEAIWKPLRDKGESGKTIEDLLAYYADECGEYVSVDDIKELASEFWKHGKKSVANFYRGAVQHTNGVYTALLLIYLNLLVGNVDHRGGLTVGGGHWHELGDKGGAYNLKSLFGGTKASPTGLNIAREKASYTGTFPAKRPYFPLTSNIWQEVIAGIRESEDVVGYKVLAVWFHMANPNYAMPGAGLTTQMLLEKDPNDPKKYKVPLAISTDIVMGETSAYCDYILPDVSYYERWATPHVAPNVPITASGVRQPVLSQPVWPDTRIAEDIYIDVAKRLNLPGFGDQGFGTQLPDGTPLPASRQKLNSAEDWYHKMIINLAIESEKVPKKDGSGYITLTDWQNALAKANAGDETELDDLENYIIDYVLARGGVFEDWDTAYSDENGNTDMEHGQYMRKKYNKLATFYNDTLATTPDVIKSSGSNVVYFSGVGIYERIKNAKGEEIREIDANDSKGTGKKYPFQLITFKSVVHTQSRTIACPWLINVTNDDEMGKILINEEDAKELGIKTGDKVRIYSRSSEDPTVRQNYGDVIPEYLEGEAVVTKGIMKGVIGVSHNFGHFQYGASDWEEDGKIIKGDKNLKKGIQSNFIMRLDESLNHTVCLQDLIGGSASFYDTYIRIEKV